MQVKYQKPKGSYKGNRVKYKTEMCKLWADNKQCKFGDKVRLDNNYNLNTINSACLLMEKRKSKRKIRKTRVFK